MKGSTAAKGPHAFMDTREFRSTLGYCHGAASREGHKPALDRMDRQFGRKLPAAMKAMRDSHRRAAAI